MDEQNDQWTTPIGVNFELNGHKHHEQKQVVIIEDIEYSQTKNLADEILHYHHNVVHISFILIQK